MPHTYYGAVGTLITSVLLGACVSAQTIPSNSLVGLWTQQDTECGMAIDVRELEIRADGSFSVTWRPFESYRDYWGRWSFDERTRALELVMERGNNRPADFIGRGRITFSEEMLDLGEISLGSAYGREPCGAPFRRLPGR